MGIESAIGYSLIGWGMAAAAGVSAYGSYKEGQDAAEASRYNADISKQNADLIEKAGALDASRQRKQGRILTGKQKSLFGSSGIELSGSPLDVMIQTSAENELDARIMEFNTKVKANAARSQGAYDERLAGIHESAGMTKAGSTLLTSASQIGSGYIGGYKTPQPTQIGSYTGYKTSQGKAYYG